MLIFIHPTFQLLNHFKTLHQLQQIHAQTITQGLILLYPSQILTKILFSFTLLTTPLPPSLDYALSVFSQIPNPSTFNFNTLIRAHTLHSSFLNALNLFAEMRSLGIPPDFHTFPFALKACAHLRAPTIGRAIHSQALKFGFIGDHYVGNTLIHLYSDMNSMVEVRQMFDEVLGRDIVSYNALIAGYVKAGEFCMARGVFDSMPVRDAVSWGTLVAGYAQMNRCKEALELFDEMLTSSVAPDSVAVVGALSACAQLGELERGRAIHIYVKQNRIRLNYYISTGLVDMYAKCGSIDTARDVFESSPEKNVFTWNAMIVGLAMHGHGELSLEYFSRMCDMGIQPDGVTFLGVLVGCSHAGLLDSARRVFDEMERIHRVRRGLSHYGCMADLLGRAGLIEEAIKMVEGMPMEGDVYVWGGLLGGCRIHGNVEVAEIAAGHLMALDPDDGGTYSIMANIYANARRWEDVAKVRTMMHNRRVKKNAGGSLIQVNGVSHEFVAGERLHPHIDEICWVLDGIGRHLLEANVGAIVC
ncbi:hypothetical protein MRB53_027337 [Persea americana]|uniref:Uncharacterized protein n=1 Tax=Persea americana TaxID=3435 RepID=A0ACC2LKK3_PERAE|nr:hypothetical protein MRB53_027337 [Persea americana]|eukprot:TRINITY_DN6758_c1_g1_i1.p1 TRINITY_DN6758_c1_g1~~TRINITY_DN6758_c1_g1_i1.p1  ORF type:complete len:529 (-),score=81.37 TRINITY_DN6758_c1_g1_i1:90-1676(-)